MLINHVNMKFEKCSILRSHTGELLKIFIGFIRLADHSRLIYDRSCYIIEITASEGHFISKITKGIIIPNRVLGNKVMYEDKMISDMFSDIDPNNESQIKGFISDCMYYLDDTLN